MIEIQNVTTFNDDFSNVLHISGQKQLADPLTKMMDPSVLIDFLQKGKMNLLAPSTASKKRSREKHKYAPDEEVYILDGNEISEEDLEAYSWYEIVERNTVRKCTRFQQEAYVSRDASSPGSALGFLVKIVQAVATAALRTIAEGRF